jgi:hypothetical protein
MRKFLPYRPLCESIFQGSISQKGFCKSLKGKIKRLSPDEIKHQN